MPRPLPARRLVPPAVAALAVAAGAAAALLLPAAADSGYADQSARPAPPAAAAAAAATTAAAPAHQRQHGRTGAASDDPSRTGAPAARPSPPRAAPAGPLVSTRVATRGSGRLLAATLTGDVEVPGPGDPDGTGLAVVRVDAARGKVCVETVVSGINPIAAVHIHKGGRGAAGPVAVGFPVTGETQSGGCQRVDRALARRIRSEPEAWYVNVHTADFENGALRGQLMW